MKSKYIAMVLAFSLTLSLLSGCGKQEQAVSSIPEEAVSESFGATVESTAQEEDVITVPEESEVPVNLPESSAADTEFHSEEAPVSAVPMDISQKALFAVAYCDAVDQLRYDPEDPMYFWRAVGYLAGIAAEDMLLPVEDEFVTLTEEDVRMFGHALFAVFPQEIPIVTEEDPLVSRGENGTWLVHIFDMSDLTAEYAYSEDGSSCTISMTLRGELLAESLVITTVPHLGTDDEVLWFPRSISSAETVR